MMILLIVMVKNADYEDM